MEDWKWSSPVIRHNPVLTQRQLEEKIFIDHRVHYYEASGGQANFAAVRGCGLNCLKRSRIKDNAVEGLSA